MPSINDTFGNRLERLGLFVPDISLPTPAVDLQHWAVVACDQYTSDRDYWNAVDAEVGSRPSTLRLILPEVFLGESDVPDRVRRIHAAMGSYLAGDVLTTRSECIVYVRRTTEHSGLREGLVIAIDLERYDFSPKSKSLVRATEATIVDRIPPRLAVRRGAPLELPHIMVLTQDPDRRVIEGWSSRVSELERLYDVSLMQHGGRVEGYRIDAPEHIDEILSGFERLHARACRDQGTNDPLFWAMGDGNHSLATAKASWEEIKTSLRRLGHSTGEISRHPARYALVEIVNIHSSGLRFEPIHRAIFTSHRDALTRSLEGSSALVSLTPIAEPELASLLAGPDGQDKTGYYDGERLRVATWKPDAGLPPAIIDGLFDAFRVGAADAKIDFIHGWDDAKKLTAEGAGVFLLPVIARDRLFGYVQDHGPLPRKSFSMGDAEEKRYYLEARRITR